jgi:hypothetical protein
MTHNRRHVPPDEPLRRTFLHQHQPHDFPIKHSRDGNSICRRLNSRRQPDSLDQRKPMMRARAAKKRSIDIEKHQSPGHRIFLL